MKKVLSLLVLLFVLVSVSSAAVHPLYGKWKFSYVIDDCRYYDYVTISLVNTKTKRVVGYNTKYPSQTLAGYYNGNIVLIMDSVPGDNLEGYYFTFQGTTPLKKYMLIGNQGISVWAEFYVEWRQLWTTKLSGSTAPTASTEIMTLSDFLNQKALKMQALLRESMTARTLLE